MTTPERTLTWTPGRPVDVAATLAPHRRGSYDPTHLATTDGAIWRACRVAGRPVTVRMSAQRADGTVEVTAWGAAADALESVPAWLGADDRPEEFRPRHRVLADAARRYDGLLVGRTGAVAEALVPAILEQKVTSIEAYRGWARLVRRFGEPAPGVVPHAVETPVPAGLRVAPTPDQWVRIPSWEWHRAGVGPQRARTVVTAMRVADQLERVAQLPSDEADRRLRSVPGIGPWTSAEVRQRVLGDADAVSVGDAGLPHLVTFALAGERRGTDDRMLELLEPYRGHRHRVCVLLTAAGPKPPRRAPRAPIRDYRSI